jgi:tetratricopeptide (TPR) repeat protein
MKTKWIYTAMAALIFMSGAVTAWSQATAKVEGRITNGDKPMANANVVLTSTATGRTYKMKADQNGHFESIGIPTGIYDQEVSDTSGQKLAKVQIVIKNDPNQANDLSLDVSQAVGSGISKEEFAKKKAEHDKAVGENALIAQVNPLLQAKNWAAAEPLLNQLVAANPSHWEYQQLLGNAQLSQEKYDDAIATYDKAIPVAENATKTDAKADPAKAKAGIAQMLNSEGNAYLKLKKNDKAIEAFTKSAELDPNPGSAFFNICAVQYNSGNSEGAVAACDKAIAADPNRADAYFIKGSLMMGESKQDKDGKLQAPPGTAEALNKYLELAPDGPHANDVKQMLTFIGAKIETTYKEKKKK